MTVYNFDEIIDRRGTDSTKWALYGSDVIPMWTADMDFRSSEPIINALQARVAQGVFGYSYMPWANNHPIELIDVLRDKYQAQDGWATQREDYIFVPSLIYGVNNICHLVGEPGDDVLLTTPAYWPFLSAISGANRNAITVPLSSSLAADGSLYYEMDFDAIEAAITPRTKLLIMCNPHNPVGRVYSKAELERIAEIALRHDLVICSDEIHAGLVYEGHKHISIASLSPEIADRTFTLASASKTYNLPGLGLGYVVCQNEAYREAFYNLYGLHGAGTNALGYVAALAAFRDSDEWLQQVLNYLAANRDYAYQFIQENFPGVKSTRPEATYLLFLDFRETGMQEDPTKFFLDHGKVALSGNWEPQGWAGFTRLNYAMPRVKLTEALEQMQRTLQHHLIHG